MDFKDVPFSFVPHEVKLKLLNLDRPSRGYGNNWKFLAGQFGFNAKQVLTLEIMETSHGSNTLKLLDKYSKDPTNTVGKLIEALNQINRPREIKELQDSEYQILQSYQDCNISTDFSFDTEDKTSRSQYIYNSQNDEKSNNLDNYYRNFDTVTSISGYQHIPQKSYDYKKSFDYISQQNSLLNSSKYFCEDKDDNSAIFRQKIPEKYSSMGLKVSFPFEDHISPKKDENVRLFISYGDGDKFFHRDVLRFCQHLDELFHCNVDLKNHRLSKQKVKDYFQFADFVIVCCNNEYKKTVESHSSLINEEDPQALHTRLIYKNMYKLYKAGHSIEHFIPVLLNGCNESDIPDWLKKTEFFKWPSQKDNIISYIRFNKKLMK